MLAVGDSNGATRFPSFGYKWKSCIGKKPSTVYVRDSPVPRNRKNAAHHVCLRFGNPSSVEVTLALLRCSFDEHWHGNSRETHVDNLRIEY